MSKKRFLGRASNKADLAAWLSASCCCNPSALSTGSRSTTSKHVLSVKPDAKVGILYQNDDFGRDFLDPFKKVLADAGGKAQVIIEQTYDLSDPTVIEKRP